MTNAIDTYLSQIQARSEAASPGEWKQVGIVIKDQNNLVIGETYGCAMANRLSKNAEFIAHSRTDIDVLREMVLELIRQRNQYIGFWAASRGEAKFFEEQDNEVLNEMASKGLGK